MTAYTQTIFGPTIGYVQPGSLYYYYPPDNALAVGPTLGALGAGIVMAENASIEWGMVAPTTAATGSVSSPTQQTLTKFFASLKPYGQIFDPRVVYDSINNRFVVTADEVNSRYSQSSVLVAVSNTSDPTTGGWSFQSVNTGVPTGKRSIAWADYPTVAVDGKNIVISTNQFASNNYKGSYQFVLQDTVGTSGPSGSGLYGGGTSKVTVNSWGGAYSAFSSVQEVSAPTGTYGLSYNDTGTLSVEFQSNSGTGLGASYVLPLAAGADASTAYASYTAPQPNSSWSLDAGDGRVVSAKYGANGMLYAVFEVKNPATGTPAVYWVELNPANLGTATNPIVNQGTITGPNGETAFNPSIAVDGSGDVIINFTASGAAAGQYATDYFSVMPFGSTSGFSTPVAYQVDKAGTAYTQGSRGVARWGDYSSAIVDPNNPGSGFWLSNEYATGASSWATVLDQVTLGASGTVLSFAPGTASPGGGTTTTTTTAALQGDVPARVLAMSDLLGGISFHDLFGGHVHGSHPHGPGLSGPSEHASDFAGLTWPGPSEHGSFGLHHNG